MQQLLKDNDDYNNNSDNAADAKNANEGLDEDNDNE